MKSLLKPVFAAGLILSAASPMAVAPAAAQVVKGIGIVDINNVVANSNAYKVAEQQRTQTYKAQFDQANQRAVQINTQLDPLLKKFEADRQAPTPNQQALQQQATAIDQIYEQGQREVNAIMAPVALSRSYVAEQIGDVLPKAVENAAKRRNVSLILSPDNLRYADPAYNLDQAVIDELNTLLPSAQLVPPTGWLPRQLREQQAAAQAAQGVQPQAAAPATPAAPATVPAGPSTEGR